MELEDALEELRAYGNKGPSASREACREVLTRLGELEVSEEVADRGPLVITYRGRRLRWLERWILRRIEVNLDSEENAVVQITMPRAMYDELEQLAADRGVGVVEFIRRGTALYREIALRGGEGEVRVDGQTCSVCENPAVFEIVNADPEKGNLACGEHRRMWPLSEARRLTDADERRPDDS